MTFGKRQMSGTQEPDFTSPYMEARLTALRDEMRRIMRDAAALVNSAGTSSHTDSKTDATFPVISLAGFSRHFSFQSGEQTKHCVYGYASTSAEATIDWQAQLDMLALTTRVVAVNAACKGRGGLSLQHLLQDAGIRASLDYVIVRAAYFVAFFDNMLMAQPAFTGSPIERARGVDYVRLKANQAQWTARASGMMSDPSHHADYVPDTAWPVIGSEIVVDDQLGQTVVNEVYLPPEMVGPVLDRAAGMQRMALA